MTVKLGKIQQGLASHLNQAESRVQAEGVNKVPVFTFSDNGFVWKSYFYKHVLAVFDNILYRL